MNHWIFDLDGTLVDSFSQYFNVLEEILGTKADSQTRKRWIGSPPAQILMEKIGPAETKKALKIIDQRCEQEAHMIETFAEIRQIFKLLKNNQKKIGIWTARDFKSAVSVLKHVQLDDFVEHLVTGDCVNKSKPHPEGLIKMKNHFGCKFSDMIMIGDHDHDMIAAHTTGVFCIRASWHNHWTDEECRLSDKRFYCSKEFHDWIYQQMLVPPSPEPATKIVSLRG